MRKRVFALLLCFTLPQSACGQGREEIPEPVPTVTATPAPTPTPTPEPEPPADPYAYIGSDINSFYAAFGYPNSSEYGPSCMGPGEDGLLYYSGFTVYTYRVDGVETIQDVG